MLSATSARENNEPEVQPCSPLHPVEPLMGPGTSQWVWSLKSWGGFRRQQAAVPPLNPCNSILGHELEERQARATGVPEAPPAPLLLLDDVAVWGYHWAGPGVEFFRGPLRWDGEILYRCWCLNEHIHHTHKHDPQEDLHSCVKGTPPLPNVAVALCEAHSNTHRWRAAAPHWHSAHQAVQEK